MSLKSRFFSILTVAIAAVAFATAAMAQDTTTPTTKDGVKKRDKGGMNRGGRHEGMRGRKFGQRGGGFGLRGITLTDAQKDQIKAIRQANKPDASVVAELKAIRDARKAGTAITPEQKARMKAVREQMRTKSEGVRQQILNVLTAEQKTQIEQRKQEMKQRRPERQRRQARPGANPTKIT
ncbi:MAG TPA: Spy/CpxP family protein refolding chaperone [Pyrinomonadaceae bacterium]|nr:Spy/CpxP family protein refolding chaperone [Pyrinomonadaceae bacterium]